MFLSTYMTIFVLSKVISILHVANGYTGLDWLGTFIATVGPMLFFLVILIQRLARTSARLWLVSGLSFVGFIFSLTGLIYHQTFLPALLGTLAFAGWIIYIFWYSKYDRVGEKMLVVGRKIPEFLAVNTQGEKVSSLAFAGKNILFLFYRGNWCPFCMAQIREIAQQYREITSLNTEIVLISPQSQKKTSTLAEKFAVPVHFWRDPQGQAAKQLRIFHQNGVPFGMQLLGYDSDTVRTTVFIRNSENELIYVDLTDNYRVRPEPVHFLQYLRAQPPIAGN